MREYELFSSNSRFSKVLSIMLYAFGMVMLGVAIILCFNESFWSDEAFSLQIIRHPYIRMVSLTANDVHPPLYYFILKFCVDAVRFLVPSASAVVIGKIVSVIPGIILYIFSLMVVRKEWGNLSSSIFAMTVVGMPHMMYYYIEIRMYSWGLLFVTLTFWYAYKVLKYKDKRNWVFFTVFALCAAYTQYFALIEAAFAYLYILIVLLIKERKRIKEWLIVCVITIVGYIPWLTCVVQQATRVSADYWIEDITFSSIKNYLIYIVCPEIVNELARIAGQALLGIFAVLILVNIYVAWKKKDEQYTQNSFFMVFAAACLPGTVAIGVLISAIMRPILVDRYLIPAAGTLWLSLAILLNVRMISRQMIQKGIAILVCVVLSATCAVNTSVRMEKENSIKSNYYKLETFLDSFSERTVVVTNDPHLVRTINTIKDVDIYLYTKEDVSFSKDFYDNVYCVDSSEYIEGLSEQDVEIYAVLNKESKYVSIEEICNEFMTYKQEDDYALERYSLRVYKLQ